uniref:Uncharacterized protein n=1 Tax=Cucumis melo TaxID=3656 RepID=A0A9I9EBT2_CUCME
MSIGTRAQENQKKKREKKRERKKKEKEETLAIARRRRVPDLLKPSSVSSAAFAAGVQPEQSEA